MRQALTSSATIGRGLVVGLVAWVGLIGCEPSADSDGDAEQPSPAEQTVHGFLKAVQYEDYERAWDLHVASTDEGAYCRSESFGKVLSKTRDEMTEADCEGARELDSWQRTKLADDARLVVQILRFACEHPDGDCRDYQRQVLTSQMPNSELAAGLDAFDIGEVRVDGDRATAYVDYWRGQRTEGEVDRASIEVRRIDGEWVVSTQFDTAGESKRQKGKGN